ncbi:MAG TPA: Uma2 family endonuclease [Ilumatobacter sp.]|nr:Uma2 family endonuclease [Ilumatobacter sp.]
MGTLDPHSPEAEAIIESRRRTGADRFDEVWEGVYHMNSAPRNYHQLTVIELSRALYAPAKRAGLVVLDGVNIGVPDDFRIPDLVLLADVADVVWNPTAPIVVEVLSPGDDTPKKLPFYVTRGVSEALVVDPDARTVQWLRNDGTRFVPAAASTLLGVTDLVPQIDWPGAV